MLKQEEFGLNIALITLIFFHSFFHKPYESFFFWLSEAIRNTDITFRVH